jgi:hypothetical protein
MAGDVPDRRLSENPDKPFIVLAQDELRQPVVTLMGGFARAPLRTSRVDNAASKCVRQERAAGTLLG